MSILAVVAPVKDGPYKGSLMDLSGSQLHVVISCCYTMMSSFCQGWPFRLLLALIIWSTMGALTTATCSTEFGPFQPLLQVSCSQFMQSGRPRPLQLTYGAKASKQTPLIEKRGSVYEAELRDFYPIKEMKKGGWSLFSYPFDILRISDFWFP